MYGRKARIGRYLWSKGQPQGPFRKAVGSRRAPTRLTFFRFFSLGDHHFLSSCLARRLNPCTNFCIHLDHIPPPPPALSLRMLRLVLPPKPLLYTQDTRFFVANQALELLFQRQWTGLSRWIFVCRSPPNPHYMSLLQLV